MFYFYFRGQLLVEPSYIHPSHRRRMKTKEEIGQIDGVSGLSHYY